jgi:hypothetical protein
MKRSNLFAIPVKNLKVKLNPEATNSFIELSRGSFTYHALVIHPSQSHEKYL